MFGYEHLEAVLDDLTLIEALLPFQLILGLKLQEAIQFLADKQARLPLEELNDLL